MKIEKEVCSLEPAKRLKELGVKQDSLWYHAKFEDDSYLDVIGSIPYDPFFQIIQRGSFEFVQFDEIYSAFTVAEFGEMLPPGTYSFKFAENDYRVWNETVNFSEIKEADARAKLVIYAKENKLIEPEDA